MIEQERGFIARESPSVLSVESRILQNREVPTWPGQDKARLPTLGVVDQLKVNEKTRQSTLLVHARNELVGVPGSALLSLSVRIAKGKRSRQHVVAV